MTHQQINERIVIALGTNRTENPHVVKTFKPPNYSESLDACREFESKLTGDDRSMYMDFIYLHIVRTNNEAVMGFENQWAMFNAPPLQRCEAFLRMKGQWDEN